MVLCCRTAGMQFLKSIFLHFMRDHDLDVKRELKKYFEIAQDCT